MNVPHAQAISAALGEAEQMRAATAHAHPTASVRLEVRQFRKLADLMALLCGIASSSIESDFQGNTGTSKEPTMPEDRIAAASPTMAQLADEMISAEVSLIEAEDRLKAAARDRELALDALTELRSKIDRALAELTGSRLPPREPADASKSDEDVLMLNNVEQSEEEASLIMPSFSPLPVDR